MTTPADSARTRRPRSDAARNRSRVSDAAIEVFAEHGLDATVSDIAERARVGNGTVFRHFATKVDLLAEVAVRWLEDWRGVLEDTLARDPAGTVLRGLIAELFDRLRQNRLALDLFRAEDFERFRQDRPAPDPFRADDGDVRVSTSRRAVEAHLTEALHRAVRDGLVSADITYADLTVLVLGTAGRLSDLGDADPSRWRRLADLTWTAIAARERGPAGQGARTPA